MAHTNATANYELSQFLGTDKPAWLVDYNGDMLKIDTALKDIADAEAASAEDIQELQDAIGAEGLTGRITDIENDIGDIKTEIGVVPLPTTAQSLTGAIAELKGVNDDQNTAIGQNANNIAQVGGAVEGVSQLAYTIANVYDSSSTYAVGDYAIYQNTLYKCTTAINVGETFDPSKWTSVKVMSEVGQGGGGSSYSAGDGIDITNNVISFDGSTANYDNTTSGLLASTIQGAIDENAANIASAPTQVTTESLANNMVLHRYGKIRILTFDATGITFTPVIPQADRPSHVTHLGVIFANISNTWQAVSANMNSSGAIEVNVPGSTPSASYQALGSLTWVVD